MQPLILLDRHVRGEEVSEAYCNSCDAELGCMACWLAWRRSCEEEVEAQRYQPEGMQGDEPWEMDWKKCVHCEGCEVGAVMKLTGFIDVVRN